MKRTTYMLCGFYALVFVLSAASFFFFTQKSRDNERSLLIEGEATAVDLSPAKVVLLQARVPELTRNGRKLFIHYGECPLTLSASDDSSGAGTLYCPESLARHLKQTLAGDTLWLEFDLREMMDDHLLVNGWAYPSLQNSDSIVRELKLTLPQGTSAVISRLMHQPVCLQGLWMDSLSVTTLAGSVTVEESHFRSFCAEGNSLRLCSGSVENLCLDLDRLNSWETHPDSFTIGTEYLTGSGRHSNPLKSGECRRMVWSPKEERAGLRVEIEGACELLLSGGK